MIRLLRIPSSAVVRRTSAPTPDPLPLFHRGRRITASAYIAQSAGYPAQGRSLFNRTWREQQVGDDSADNTDDNFATAFDSKLRRQHRIGMDGDNDNQRSVPGQSRA